MKVTFLVFLSRYGGMALCVYPLSLLFFISSCSYGKQIQDQEVIIKQLTQKMTVLAKELTDVTQKLNKRESELEALRFEMGMLRKELLEQRSPSVPPEQSQTERISKLVQELANPSCDTNRLAFELRELGKRAVLALLEALKKPDADYRARVEKTFSGLLADDAVPLLLPCLKDPVLRIPAARILGNLKNYSVVNELSEYLSGDDENFVFTVAESLVKLKDKRGISTLIDYLKKTDSDKRVIAFNLLYKITDLTLDYKHYGGTSETIEGAKRWEEWWFKNAPTFIFPSGE